MVILDTNVLSALMRPSLNRVVVTWLDGQTRLSIWTTTISVMEIYFGLATMPDGRRRSQQLAEFQRIMEDDLQHRMLPFDTEAAEQTGNLIGARQLAGRPGDLRDSMIAGIALVQRATVATRNVRHFDDLDLKVVNPWED
jgi:predicted nucleic acid-binding protein